MNTISSPVTTTAKVTPLPALTKPIATWSVFGEQHAFHADKVLTAPNIQAGATAMQNFKDPVALLKNPSSYAASLVTVVKDKPHSSFPTQTNVAWHAYDEYSKMQFDPSVVALKNGAITYLPVHSSGPGKHFPGNAEFVLGGGFTANSLDQALQAAQELSQGNAPGLAIVEKVTKMTKANGDDASLTSYLVQPLTYKGVKSTRLGDQPFSHDVHLTPNKLSYPDLTLLPSGVLAVVDGSYLAGVHSTSH